MDIVELLKGFHFFNSFWIFALPIAMIGLDILTGLTKAFVGKDFKSTKMRKGFGKKIGEIATLVIGELLSYALVLPPILIMGVSMYLTFMELMSNLENLDALGVPLPKWLTDCLSQVDTIIQTGTASGTTMTPEQLQELMTKILMEDDLK